MAKGKHRFRRRSNANLKLRRATSWLRGEERKKARQLIQTEAHRRNLKAGTSPWDVACLIRSERRFRDPEVQRRRQLHEAEAAGRQ